jgi:serine/threonine protein kinase
MLGDDDSPKRKGEAKKKIATKRVTKRVAKRPPPSSRAKKVPKSELCGDYKIMRKLGEGAFGKVYEVEKDGRNYAIKMMDTSLKFEGLNILDGSIFREVDFLNRLKHPNVLHSVESFVTSSQACVVMPIMESDLHKVIKGALFNNQEEAIYAYKQALCGLAYLHSNYVIHTDLKPQNIFYDLSTRTCKLADFGGAIHFGKSMKTKYFGVVTTSFWRPPEIFAMESRYSLTEKPPSYHFGPEIDIYAMGLIGLELIFGIEPNSFSYDGAENNDIFSLEVIRSRGGSPGPLFGELEPRFKELIQKMFDARRQPFTVGVVDKSYYDRRLTSSISGPLKSIFEDLKLMVCSAPENRPRSLDLINNFPDEVFETIDPTCEKVSTFYQPANIRYTSSYTEKVRQNVITLIRKFLYNARKRGEIGNEELQDIECCAIDLADRIFSVIPARTEDGRTILTLLASSIAIALHSNWGGDPTEFKDVLIDIVKSSPGEFFESYSNIIPRVLQKLNYQIYRPSLAQLNLDIDSVGILNILREELSPSDITIVPPAPIPKPKCEDKPYGYGMLSWAFPSYYKKNTDLYCEQN